MTMQSRLSYPAAVLLVCAAVGLLLTLCDRLAHVQFGVLAYSNPLLFGQAWWVLPNFIGAALGMYLGAKMVFLRYLSPASGAEIAFSLAWFVAAYFATGLFWQQPDALLAGLLLAWLLRMAFARDRVVTLLYSLVLAVIGCAMEGTLSAIGGFAYAAPDAFNVPYWLAGLYMNGAFVVLQVVQRVESRHGRRQGG